jgi:hypothetical protein
MADRSIVFTKPWGERSWLVQYAGPYQNNRPPHVEVVGYTPTAGQVCRLTNLRVTSPRSLGWDVEGVTNRGAPAHFTVYFGAQPGARTHEFQ